MFAKIKASIIALKAKVSYFLTKYQTYIHALIVGWTLFATSWMTGKSIPLSDLGLPWNLDARQLISHIQAAGHISTKWVAAITFLVNITMAYKSWSKKNENNSQPKN